MKKQKPIVDKRIKLEKFPGKGGWTFARIHQVMQDKNAPFGWVKVRGTIDDVKITKYHLMPMGSGKLFLAIKAEIRKKINKHEGDTVHVVLYPDNEPLTIPEELQLCLEDEPKANRFFQSLSESEQNHYIRWIYSSKKQETKINRMAKCIDRLARGLKMYDQSEK